jgi:hypothetical protein
MSHRVHDQDPMGISHLMTFQRQPQLTQLGCWGSLSQIRETITTAFVESAVNHLVSKRMVKQQQMHWTERGAHLLLLLLLQVRARVLNGELRQNFCPWYPRMKEGSEQSIQLAA